MNKENTNYRILTKDGKFLNAGTGEDSWFSLDDARKTVDYSKGQKIVEIALEIQTQPILWEIL